MIKKQNKKGFTLIEVMLVLALGGLIMGMAFLAFRQASVNRRDTQRRADANRLVTELQNYYNDKSSWPNNAPNPGVTACTTTANTFTTFIKEYVCEGTDFKSPSGNNYNLVNFFAPGDVSNVKDNITFTAGVDCGLGSNTGGAMLTIGLEKGGNTCKVIK
jgi:prepilin-type N-terminal cleavage/methylation domain-containing protein